MNESFKSFCISVEILYEQKQDRSTKTKKNHPKGPKTLNNDLFFFRLNDFYTLLLSLSWQIRHIERSEKVYLALIYNIKR